MALRSGNVSEAIAFFDNGLLDTPGIGATYVVRGDDVALIETGTSLCAPAILEELAALGIRPQEVRHILLTHVHMDHAGGAGALARAMPEAQVYIHSLTGRHLIDPSRLLPSAERALGDLFARHGTIVPLSPEKVVPAEDLDLDLGRGVRLQAIPTPGHSPDHLSYYEPSSGALFAGDAVGIVLPDFQHLGPVTPPPVFDVMAQQATFARLSALSIQHLLFTHWGPAHQPATVVIQRLQAEFERFDQLMRERIAQGVTDEDALVRAWLGPRSASSAGDWVIEGWARMSIKGLGRYYAQRQPR